MQHIEKHVFVQGKRKGELMDKLEIFVIDTIVANDEPIKISANVACNGPYKSCDCKYPKPEFAEICILPPHN